jgi:hypothetical protein
MQSVGPLGLHFEKQDAVYNLLDGLTDQGSIENYFNLM